MMPTIKTPSGFPACISLSIDFNRHANYYLSVEAWLKEEADADREVEFASPEERQRAIETGSVWICQWYPITPIGFCLLAASSFDALIAAVLVRSKS